MGRPFSFEKTAHWSLGKELKPFVKKLNQHGNVIKKVHMGRAENARHKFSPGTVICKNILDNNTLEFVGYSGNGLVKIYVILLANVDRRKVIDSLEIR